jgi:hypothetical protein
MEMMRSVYPHDQVFGEFRTVNSYIDCPPDELLTTGRHLPLEEDGLACEDSRPPRSPVCGSHTTDWVET